MHDYFKCGVIDFSLIIYRIVGINQVVVQHTLCDILICTKTNPRRSRCIPCSRFHSTLLVRQSRRRHMSNHPAVDRISASSSVRYSLLSKEEMKHRMKSLHDQVVIMKKQRTRLNEQLKNKLETESVTLDQSDHADMTSIIQNEGQAFLESSTTTTFQRIFWQQQIDATRISDARGMRWHPLMIRFCIYLRHQSQSAYETLRQSNCVSLPSQRTLRDYTHHTKAKPGFSAEVDSQVCLAAGLESATERERHVILIVDEMHIKEDLVFNKHTG